MLVLLIIILPLVFAALTIIAGEKQAKNTATLGAVFTLAAGIAGFHRYAVDATSKLLVFHTEWIKALNADFYIKIDGINSILLLLTVLLMPFIIQSTQDRITKSPRAFYSLMLVMQSAMLGVFLAKDAMLFYIFWELSLLPIYLLALIWGGEHKKRITFKFFVFTLFGSLFMLLAIIFVWLHNPTRSFSIYDFYTAGALLTAPQQLFVFIAFYLAFAIKIPIFPLHSWHPDTYVTAPTQGTMLLSGIMLKMGAFALIVWLIPIAPLGWHIASKYVIILSVISVVYGSMMALVQHNFKRMLAYSSLGHVGLIAAGIFSWNLQGVQGGIYQMLSHGVNVVALFYVCDILTNRMNTDNMQKMGGIRNVSRTFSVLFLIIIFGSIAIPLTNGFVGEFLLLHGIFQYNTVMAVFSSLTVILGTLYLMRAYHKIMHGETNTLTETFGTITLNEKIILAGFVVLILFFGIFPNIILQVSEPQVKQLIEHVHHALAMAKH